MKKNLLLFIISMTVLCIMAEIGLRVYGIQPGQYYQSQWFKPVKELKMKRGFSADSLGIFKVSDDMRLEILNTIDTQDSTLYAATDDEVMLYEAYNSINVANSIRNGTTVNNFATYARNTAAKQTKDAYDSALINYAFYQPINADGFRSIAFKQYGSGKKKVLLLGDSFTWGHSAEHVTNSFADELVSQGYVVYNTGMSGADPAQYLAIAKQYIPILKPDYVVTNFFMGNDLLYNWQNDSIKYYTRQVQPYQPYHYNTNAGNVIAAPGGLYFTTADSAYTFLMDNYLIPKKSLFNKLCAASSVGTLFWRALCKIKIVSTKSANYAWYWQACEKKYAAVPYCNAEIKSIDSIASLYNAKHLLITINDINSKMAVKDYPHLFEGIKYYPSPVTRQAYNTNDGHYNSTGHKQHADYIEQLIKQSQ